MIAFKVLLEYFNGICDENSKMQKLDNNGLTVESSNDLQKIWQTKLRNKMYKI